MISVIKAKGHQYLVSEGDVLKLPFIEGRKGDKITFDNVILLDDQIGRPHIKGAKVEGEITAQGLDKKIIIFKYKPKKRYKKKQGHRQAFTKVKITKILG